MKKVLFIGLIGLLLPQIARAQTHHEVAFAGDSIIAGDKASTYANSLEGRLLCSRPYWYIKNYGVDGASISGVSGVTLSQNAVVGLLCDTIVVFAGTNDWSFNASRSTFQSDYTTFINNLGFLSPSIICVTPIWRSDEGGNNTAGYSLAQLRTDITTICAAKSYPVIDGTTLVPNNSSFYVDGVHPNDNGYALFATNLSSALGALIP